MEVNRFYEKKYFFGMFLMYAANLDEFSASMRIVPRFKRRYATSISVPLLVLFNYFFSKLHRLILFMYSILHYFRKKKRNRFYYFYSVV